MSACAQFGHQLANDSLGTGEAALLLLEVFSAVKAAVGKVVNEAAEYLHAVGPVAARIKHMHVPVQVAVLAGGELFIRMVMDRLQECAIFEFGGIGLFQRPAVLDRSNERDGGQVQCLDLGSECHLVFSMMRDCPGSPMLG